MLAQAPTPTATAVRSALPPVTPETREIVARVRSRNVPMWGELAVLRERYAEVLRWINPPWDPDSRRVDPRPGEATADRGGRNKIHTDWVGQAVTRWAALETAIPPVFRCVPPLVHPPLPEEDPEKALVRLKAYDVERAKAQDLSSQIEDQTVEWMRESAFHRTLLWASWSANAFGKGILKDGWDPDAGTPTLELFENPGQVAYGWSKRYGNRRLSWVSVVAQMAPEEIAYRFHIDLPLAANGLVDMGGWAGATGDAASSTDLQAEQQDSNNRMVWVSEYWEVVKRPGHEHREVLYALVIADRVVDGPTYYPWKRLPFHVIENEHVLTWLHGKSMAEGLIPLNEAYDDMLDRQQVVIDFESGPRYKGIGMYGTNVEADLPDPFHYLPLREGQDILQIDTRVDFFPTQVHGNELREAKYKQSGLTPIAWGMSPNAQTSGRAMSAEWRAVELPLGVRLVNMTPEVLDIFRNWWDYAEAYDAELRDLAHGYRRFELVWQPFDIRDRNEKIQGTIALYNSNLIDPETAIQEAGYENVDEIVARVRSYLMDPVWNPLRRQQLLLLEQLALQIEMQKEQLKQQQAASAQAAPTPSPTGASPTPPGAPVGNPAQQQQVVAGAEAQGTAPPAGPAENQTEQQPIPIQSSVMSQSPMQPGVGMGTRIMLAGPTSGNGQAPR